MHTAPRPDGAGGVVRNVHVVDALHETPLALAETPPPALSDALDAISGAKVDSASGTDSFGSWRSCAARRVQFACRSGSII